MVQHCQLQQHSDLHLRLAGSTQQWQQRLMGKVAKFQQRPRWKLSMGINEKLWKLMGKTGNKMEKEGLLDQVFDYPGDYYVSMLSMGYQERNYLKWEQNYYMFTS